MKSLYLFILLAIDQKLAAGNENATEITFNQFVVCEGDMYQLHGMPHSPGSQTVWTFNNKDADPSLRFAVHNDSSGTTFSLMCAERNGSPACKFDPWSGTLTLLNISIGYYSTLDIYSFNGDFKIGNLIDFHARTTPVMFQPPPDTITDGDFVDVQCRCERYSWGEADVSWYVDNVKVATGDNTQTINGNVSTVVGNATILMTEEYHGKNFTCGVNSNIPIMTWRVYSEPHVLNIQPASQELNDQSEPHMNDVQSSSLHSGKYFLRRNRMIREKKANENVNLAFEPETVFAMEFDENYQFGAEAWHEHTRNSTWYKDGRDWNTNVVAKISEDDGGVYSGACLSQSGEILCDVIEKSGTLIIKNVTISHRGTYEYRYASSFPRWHKYVLEVSSLAQPEIVVKPPDVISDGDSVPVTCSVGRLYPEEVYVSWFIGTTNVTAGTTSIDANGEVFAATNVAVITMSSDDDGKDLTCIALARKHRGLLKTSEPFKLNIS